MSLLDDLKNKAEKKQAGLSQKAEDQALRQTIYQERILPRMQATYRYMDELVEYLTVLDEPITVSEYTTRYRELNQLEQNNYRLSSDTHGGQANIDKIELINLSYELTADGSFLYKLVNPVEVESEINFLHSHRIPFNWRRPNTNMRDNFVNFTVERVVPVLVTFSADIPTSLITLDIYNQEDFDHIHRILEPEALTNEFLDVLGRYLLREDREFVRIEISEQNRIEIQLKLEEDKKQREAELAAIEAAELAAQQAQDDQTIKNKIKGLIGQLKK